MARKKNYVWRVDPRVYWAVKQPEYADPFYFTIRLTRREAINAFMDLKFKHDINKWEWWRRRGFKAVKIKMKVVK